MARLSTLVPPVWLAAACLVSPARAQARRDVQALTALGVEGFQIDSAYQDFFDKPLP